MSKGLTSLVFLHFPYLVVVVQKWVDGLLELHEGLLVLGHLEVRDVEQLGRVQRQDVVGAVVQLRVGPDERWV